MPKFQPDSLSAIRQIITSVHQDLGNRGLIHCVSQDEQMMVQLNAATSLINGNRIAILTGFTHSLAKIGENDGLSGSLTLATALHQLGKKVVLITDRFSHPLLSHAMQATPPAIQLESIPSENAKSAANLQAMIEDFAPSHVIAIERPGSASNGHRHSMHGLCIDAFCPPADNLFDSKTRTYATIAIGDGGNELGMGNFFETCHPSIPLGKTIFAQTTSDFPIVAGTSNWGSIALCATLAILSRLRLWQGTLHEKSLLKLLKEAGAVDGSTGLNTLTVDGLNWDDYAHPLDKIEHTLQQFNLQLPFPAQP